MARYSGWKVSKEMHRLRSTDIVAASLLNWAERERDAYEARQCNESKGRTGVVWSGEDRDEAAVVEELVAILDDLVGAHDEVDVEGSAGVGDDVRSEGVAGSARAGHPSLLSEVRVRPQQVELHRGIRRIHSTAKVAQLVDRCEVRREAAVHS